uniref:Odorant receptor, family 6, subfamily AT, member 1 n=1 Tax=Salmo trutta TaxID=8032 RepID=A0A673Z887_SALTR
YKRDHEFFPWSRHVVRKNSPLGLSMTSLSNRFLYLVLKVRTDPKLGYPMYFFLHNLSIVDMIYTTVTIPNMLSGFLTEIKTVPVPGCFLQMYCFIHMSVTGRALLTAMAYDRYVAICNLLRYAAVLTRPVCLLLIIGVWTFGAICTFPNTSRALQRSCCGPNMVRHCWCDPSSMRLLVCGDTQVDSIVSLSSALVALLTTGVLILTSYILIGVKIAKMGAAQRLEAFSTCAAHLTVVSISYSSASFVRIIVSVLYSALTPFLNPVIYSLRNKELRAAIKRAFCRHRDVSQQGHKTLNTLS